MSYTTWLNNIKTIISKLINLSGSVLDTLMKNYIFKTLIYIILIFFIMEMVFVIYKIVIYVINIKSGKNEGKNKEIE